MSAGPSTVNHYAGLRDEDELEEVSEWLDRPVPVSDDLIPLI